MFIVQIDNDEIEFFIYKNNDGFLENNLIKLIT